MRDLAPILLQVTPLLILGAFCFAQTSPDFEAWRERGAMAWSEKMSATAALAMLAAAGFIGSRPDT